MRSYDHLVEEARRLTADRRRRLIRDIEVSLAKRTPNGKARGLRRRRDGLARFIAMAGTAHSVHAGVSTEKCEHLADVYSARR